MFTHLLALVALIVGLVTFGAIGTVVALAACIVVG